MGVYRRGEVGMKRPTGVKTVNRRIFEVCPNLSAKSYSSSEGILVDSGRDLTFVRKMAGAVKA